MRRISRYLLALIALNLGIGAAIAEGTETDAIYKTISASERQTLMQDWGYRAALETDEDSKSIIRSSAAGIGFVVAFYDCDSNSTDNCLSIQLYAGLETSERTELSFANNWNTEFRFAKVWIDEEDDPLIEMDVNVEGG